MPPSQQFTNTHCLPIPKLNLQFLTLHDYLLRNFQLFRLETAYEIRTDVEDVVKRVQPRYNAEVSGLNKTSFSGWARMGVPIERVCIILFFLLIITSHMHQTHAYDYYISV